MYQKKCFHCDNLVNYKSKRTLEDAEKNNSCCASCRNKYRNLKPNTECSICKKEMYRIPKKIKEHNFCSYGCRNKFYSGDKSFCKKESKRVRTWDKKDRRDKKEKAVEILGGKCEICRYDKCIAAMDFHHRNPEEKDISIKDIINCSWKKIEEELKKCILLCANCHRETHWRLNNGSGT